MTPRITISVSEKQLVEIWLNEAGRDPLAKALQQLGPEDDHIHLAPKDFDGEIELSDRPYRPTDKVLAWGKIMLRPDEWDEVHYPHVMPPDGDG